MKKPTKTDRLTDDAFHEVRMSEPARVTATRWYDGDEAAEKQIRAIALEKARERGAKIPKP